MQARFQGVLLGSIKKQHTIKFAHAYHSATPCLCPQRGANTLYKCGETITEHCSKNDYTKKSSMDIHEPAHKQAERIIKDSLYCLIPCDFVTLDCLIELDTCHHHLHRTIRTHRHRPSANSELLYNGIPFRVGIQPPPILARSCVRGTHSPDLPRNSKAS